LTSTTARELRPSDFDRRHIVQASFVTELPFGPGKWIGGNTNSAIGRIIGGWELAGFLTVQSGRPYTIFSGANTLSNVVQTPADCSGCDGSEAASTTRAGSSGTCHRRSAPRSAFRRRAEFGSSGRNGFIGPGSFNLDLAFVKRTRLAGSHTFEFRVDATNVTNTPTFGFPTATVTSGTFGRIRNTVISGSRKAQIGLKYSF
jgi:hypothetical protein